jgi:chemotaxis protein CheX
VTGPLDSPVDSPVDSPGTVRVDDELVLSVVDQVWDTLLEAPATPWAGPEPSGPDVLRAEVALRGEWNGLVRLTCDTATAALIAARMLSLAPHEDLAAEDVHDAVGEVVNVVGGNVKGALGGQTSLGLPEVGALPRPPRDEPEEPVTRCVLDWQGSPVVLEVLTAVPLTTA